MIESIMMGAGISALGSILGGNKAAKAAKKASAQQVAASRQAMAQNQQFYDQSREDFAQSRADFAPYQEYGMSSLKQLGAMPDYQFNYQNEPGYQFRLNEGNKQIDRMTASGRLPAGGATMKALTRFGQDYASNEYGNAFNRDYGMYNDRYNRTASGANMGLNVAGSLGQLGTNYSQIGANYAGANSNLITGMGNAQAAGTVGKANAWSQGIQGAGNSIMDGLMLKSLMGGGGGQPQYQSAVPNSFSRMYMK